MMIRRRPTNLVSVGLASLQPARGTARKPLSLFYPEEEVRRITFDAGFDLGWKLTAVETPRDKPAPYKFVVIAGSPSWSEYWAEFLSNLPKDREMIVVDRPGFGMSGPKTPVHDIRLQAAALAPLLKAPFGQKVILVGHSYGAAIATLMAANNPGKVAGLVLLSGYFSEFGATSKLLVKLGSKVMHVIPRDLRHAIIEVTGQKPQLAHMKEALTRLRVPVHVIHGDKDDYAPFEAAEKLVKAVRTRRPVRFETIEGGDHFLHDGSPDKLMAALERCVPQRKALSLFDFNKKPGKADAAFAA
jgi:pimeloyl-ACP methyl ester carboxylesterase